ncbi:MAG: hypothetical protein OXI26_04715, partial [bacterium]|nr:hypothetical protein [bacterium]
MGKSPGGGTGLRVLACALVLATVLASCGDDPGPPLSLEEYASWCSESSLLAVAGPRDQRGPATGFGDVEDAAATVDALVENYESITPPVEVAVFHDQTLEAIRAAAAVIDEGPRLDDVSYAAVFLKLVELERDPDGASEALALEPAVRGPLTASGCLPLLQPAGARYAPAGSAIVINWEPVPGADYYTVFYDDFFDSPSCFVDSDGDARFCDELAAGVLIPRYVHTRPAPDEHYWVIACNNWHCATIDDQSPAGLITEPEPAAASTEPEPSAPPTSIPTEISQVDFEASAPEGYAPVTVWDFGLVWGTPARFTDDSDPGLVAYMLLGDAGGCSVADAHAERGATAYVRTAPLGYLDSFESAKVCRSTSDTWDTGWEGLRITHLRVFDDASPTNVTEYVYDDESGRYLATSPAPAANRTVVSPATGTQEECSRQWAREPYLPFSEAIRMCGGDVETLRSAHVEACATGDPADAGLGSRTYAEFARDSESEASARAGEARAADDEFEAAYYEDLADRYATEATDAENLAVAATTDETDRRARIIAERGVASWPEACEQMTDELWRLDLY